MPLLNGIAAHCVVEHHALHEYANPLEHNSEPNTVTRYTEIAPNVPFTVSVQVPPDFVFLGDVLVFRVFMNGTLQADVWHKALPASTDQRTGDARRDHQGIRGLFSRDDGQLIRFPHLVEHPNKNAIGDMSTWHDKEILFQVSHGCLRDHKADQAFGPAAGVVQAVGGPESVLAFTFKYRPVDILKSIISPPPWPPTNVTPETPDSRYHPVDDAFKAALQPSRSRDLYCICRKVRGSQRVATCDNDWCQIKSYHWECVGLKREPERIWLCPFCIELNEEDLVIEGYNDYYEYSYPDQECGGCNGLDEKGFVGAHKNKTKG
ncbi:related to component of histone acetyltransferase complex [Lecanosticta acicola]|uniref:Related to component of histone acetyltransferase complex n=1 Tax=Lecanosticta acicola TaxID=111012 RepID=A0AAI8YYM4_9PEZI|nr:related to component of histone acetyltransferase complex [Lecanosticta acicola]